MRRMLVAFVRFYQYCVSPVLPARCIYTPTCSQYMIQAIQQYGPLKGLWFGVRRILRCHPFASGGYDPVPGQDENGTK